MSERRLIPTMAAWLLEQAERAFLYAHGWIQKEDGSYLPPASYQAGSKKKQPVGGYTRSHAINSQKQYVYNARNGGTRVDPDLEKRSGDSLVPPPPPSPSAVYRVGKESA